MMALDDSTHDKQKTINTIKTYRDNTLNSLSFEWLCLHEAQIKYFVEPMLHNARESGCRTLNTMIDIGWLLILKTLKK